MDEKEWKTWRVAYVSGSNIIFQGSGFVRLFLFHNGETSTKYIKIYDGTNALGRQLMFVQIPATNTIPVNFSIPVFFSMGLYVKLETTPMSLTIQYKEVTRE